MILNKGKLPSTALELRTDKQRQQEAQTPTRAQVSEVLLPTSQAPGGAAMEWTTPEIWRPWAGGHRSKLLAGSWGSPSLGFAVTLGLELKLHVGRRALSPGEWSVGLRVEVPVTS